MKKIIFTKLSDFLKENIQIPTDNRNEFLISLEKDIQKNANKKDNNFRLNGDWKKFFRKQDGYNVYLVDVEWVRNNLSIIYGHGGHSYVHEFIPHDEIWVSNKHPEDCSCKNVKSDRTMSMSFINSTILHEIEENKKMKDGYTYWEAHNFALQKELELKILNDPYTEQY